MSEIHLCDICKAAPSTTLVRQCDFCGRNEREVGFIVQGENADICGECVIDAARSISERIGEAA